LTKAKTKDIAADRLRVWVSQGTLDKEKKLDYQRFYIDDVVQLRNSVDRTKGVVIRSNQGEDGGTKVLWDGREDVTLHNPRYLENVWEDEEGNEI
jgi:hypothetical protein